MLTSLADLITCPRCGPTFGLILLPDAVSEGRVEAGLLGCANCRERYPIEAGVADLRVGRGADAVPPRAGADESAGSGRGGVGRGGDGPEGALRLGALLGLAEASGPVLLAGPAVAHASALAELVEGVDVVAVGPIRVPAVSTVWIHEAIPFRNGAFGAVALTGGWADRLEEGARVLGAGGRLLLDPAPASADDRVRAAGLEPLLAEAGALVAGR
jgi:uncharacterized protein YbaR (Trm112 family)